MYRFFGTTKTTIVLQFNKCRLIAPSFDVLQQKLRVDVLYDVFSTSNRDLGVSTDIDGCIERKGEVRIDL